MGDMGDGAPVPVNAGAVLRQAREAHRLSVDDVAQALKLTPKQVVAIEGEAYDLLPGKTFARGFVRNYARLLQLDPVPLLAAVETRLAGGEVDLRPLSNAEGRMPAGGSSRGVPRLLLAGLLLATVVLAVGVYLERFGPGVGGWQGGRSTDPQSPPAPAVAEGARPIELPAPAVPTAGAGGETGTTPFSAAPAAGPSESVGAAGGGATPPVAGPVAADPSAGTPPVATPGRRRLVFRFGKEAWVEVRDGSGAVLASRLNAPGSVLDLEGEGPFALVVGNAASVELRLDDRPIDLGPHTSVSVARLRLE